MSHRFGSSELFENLGLLTVEDLAGSLGRSPKTIRNWVARRELPFVSIKGRTFFRRASIQEWLERKEFKTWE
jgi:excisionase family DNA binding protein